MLPVRLRRPHCAETAVEEVPTAAKKDQVVRYQTGSGSRFAMLSLSDDDDDKDGDGEDDS